MDMMFRWLACGAATVCLFASSDADASDPRLRRVDPLLRAPSGATALDEVTAIVRIGGATDRIALEAEGIRFRHGHDGRPIHVGPLFLVEAQRGALARVAERGMSVRVSRPIAMEPTLYATGNETQAI